jgi:hypothetical protein
MSGHSVSASVTFVDLATFGELEGFLYGGPNAITWFVASVQKANWFSFIPIPLRNIGTQAQFAAQKASFSLSRQGDYVLSTFLRARWPVIGLAAGTTAGTVRWVNNLMHNLVRNVQIEFNDLQVQEFDNYWLDDNFEWRCPANKRQGYLNMIGMISSFTNPVGLLTPLGGGHLSLPLPFFFGEDSGIALPVAALPFNDIKITYDFRDWRELVIVNPNPAGGAPIVGAATVNSVVMYQGSPLAPTTLPPALTHVETFAHYAVVHNDERVKMGDAPRDILIHQVQETKPVPFKDLTSRSSFDIRFSHAIVVFTFKARNNSLQQKFSGLYGFDQSNYTTISTPEVDAGLVPVSFPPSDPIARTTLLYENSVRLANDSDYFALTHPWYFSDAISETTGYHIYSYGLKPWDPVRPSGSTDYSKLANVSIAHDPSFAASQAAAGLYEDGTTIVFAGVTFPQTFEHVFCARNFNILRVANGSAGFPAL